VEGRIHNRGLCLFFGGEDELTYSNNQTHYLRKGSSRFKKKDQQITHTSYIVELSIVCAKFEEQRPLMFVVLGSNKNNDIKNVEREESPGNNRALLE